MATTSDLRKGITIKLEGDLYTVVDFQHVKMGRGGAFVRTRLKNLKTGVVLERTFKAGDKIDIVHLEEKSFQYIYREGDTFYFMDMETYDQLPLSIEVVGEARNYLTENMEVNIIYADGEPVGVKLPNFVELKVVETPPGVRGDTATGGSKPAKLETGLTITVPLFIKEGDIIKVDTRTGEYIERVK